MTNFNYFAESLLVGKIEYIFHRLIIKLSSKKFAKCKDPRILSKEPQKR